MERISYPVKGEQTDPFVGSHKKCFYNICCGYLLGVPCRVLVMSTHNVCFYGKIRKIFCRICPFIGNYDLSYSNSKLGGNDSY